MFPLPAWSVTDIVVAANAIQFLIVFGAVRGNLAHIIPVAIQTIGIEHGGVAGPNLDRFVKILERKCLRMMMAVAGFGQPFADEIVRHMAVVARGHSVMTGFLPAVELCTHDVTVGAGARVIRQVG